MVGVKVGENSWKTSFFKKIYPIVAIVLSDFIALFFSFLIQYFLRFYTGFFGDSNSIYYEPAYVGLGLGLLFVYWFILFFIFGLYKNWYENSPFEEFYLLLKAVIFGSLLLYTLIITDTEKTPRILIFWFLLSFLGFSFTLRLISRAVYVKLLKAKKIFFNTLVLGSNDGITKIINQVNLSPAWGYNIVKTQDLTTLNNLNKENLLPALTSLIQGVEVVLISNTVNEGRFYNIDLIQIVDFFSDNGLRVKIESDLYNSFIGTVKVNTIYGIPFLEITPQILKSWQIFAKRTFDIIFSILVLIIGLPLWCLIALIVFLETPGGVFYTQLRYGKNGRVFKIFKFRSMRADAANGLFFTVKNDSRVTKFGRLIRKTHLDEIPQFFNVLMGDMSVVGPRPEQPCVADIYHEKMPIFRRRLKVRPGITGWWQVKYTNSEITDEEMERRLKDDFYYIENLSLKFDFEIIVRTVWCVLTGHGQA